MPVAVIKIRAIPVERTAVVFTPYRFTIRFIATAEKLNAAWKIILESREPVSSYSQIMIKESRPAYSACKMFP